MNTAQTATALFSPEEQTFLDGIFARYPAVGENFKRYLAAKPGDRPAMAEHDVAQLPRAGWVRRKISDPETVQLHMAYVALYAGQETPPGLNRLHCSALGAVHDLPEVLTTDFVPGDSPTKEEKHTLELLTLRVIFEASPHLDAMTGLIREYHEQKTPEAQWVRDVDLLDPVFVALQYEAREPQRTGLFQEFAAYAAPKLKTGTGRAIYDDAVKNQDTYRTAHQINPPPMSRGPWGWRR